MLRSLRQRLGCVSSRLLIFAALAAGAAAQTLDTAVSRTLARLFPSGTIPAYRLVLEDRTELPFDAGAQVQSALRNRPDAQTSSGAAETAILRVYLTHSHNGYLMISQWEGGDPVLEPWVPKTESRPERNFRLELTLLHSQSTPILDVRSANGITSFLEPDQAALTPRDPRGRFTSQGPAYPTAASPQAFEVAPGVIGSWARQRNYFESEGGAFFSAAKLGSIRITAGLDYKVRLQDTASESVTVIDGYGSNLAVIRPGCDAPEQLLLSGAGSFDQPDRLISVQIQGRRLSEPLAQRQLPGPVTALWPSESPDAAHLVVKNLTNGMFEAYRVAIACNP